MYTDGKMLPPPKPDLVKVTSSDCTRSSRVKNHSTGGTDNGHHCAGKVVRLSAEGRTGSAGHKEQEEHGRADEGEDDENVVQRCFPRCLAMFAPFMASTLRRNSAKFHDELA